MLIYMNKICLLIKILPFIIVPLFHSLNRNYFGQPTFNMLTRRFGCWSHYYFQATDCYCRPTLRFLFSILLTVIEIGFKALDINPVNILLKCSALCLSKQDRIKEWGSCQESENINGVNQKYGCLKNIGFKGAKIISLSGAPTCLDPVQYVSCIQIALRSQFFTCD